MQLVHRVNKLQSLLELNSIDFWLKVLNIDAGESFLLGKLIASLVDERDL